VEEADEFLSLFPHRYDFIWAAHTAPNAKVEWQTETRYPLSDRILQQGSYLYGVRFGSQTQYFLLDIDTRSPFHPNQDRFAISAILAALEPLGIVSYVGCTSSYSGGLHLYFPFQQTQNSWKLAIVVTTLLENAGFKLHPGNLELFPNPKPYSTELTLFNAHRLPLQIGSYLVNQDFQPIWSSRDRFVDQWKLAQSRNDLDADVLQHIFKQTWNQQQSEDARERIRGAIADLLEQDILTAGATARFQQLLQYGIGGSTLYRHRDLWHPNHLTDLPQFPSSFKSNCPLDCNGGASNGHCPTSFFPSDGRNVMLDNRSSISEELNLEGSGRNATESVTIDPAQIYSSLQETRLRLQTEQEARQKAAELIKQQQEQHRNEVARVKQIERMQQFLNSGDSILVAEAMTWAQAHPYVLDFRRWVITFDSSIKMSHEHLQLAIAYLYHQFGWDTQQVCAQPELTDDDVLRVSLMLKAHCLDSS
jgi:hypothetical protein